MARRRSSRARNAWRRSTAATLCSLHYPRCSSSRRYSCSQSRLGSSLVTVWLGSNPPPQLRSWNALFVATPGALLGAFWEVVVRCEVSHMLLLVLLQPPPAKLLLEHVYTLEKYSWEAFDSHGQETNGQLPDELFLLFQSLVMATHKKDMEAIKSLEVEMWPLLSADQNHVLHLVLQETISPSGQGI